MSAEPVRRATAGVPAKRSEMVPTVLVPTPAQLAMGQCVVDAPRENWPRPVVLLVERAQRAGWTVRVTYSQVLDVPAIAGKYKGERVVKHFLAVRLEHRERGVMAYGTWCGTDETGWKADRAQAMLVNHWPTKSFGVMDLGRLIDGTVEIREVTGGYRLQAVAAA